MKHKKTIDLMEKSEPCRKCGGTDFTYKMPVNTRTLSFVHVRAKCVKCGTWCGGFTLMNKAKENGNEKAY